MKMLQTLVFASAIVASTGAIAQTDFAKTDLPATHPLVGSWRIELPELKCFEEYEIHTDGTKSSMSGEERNEGSMPFPVELDFTTDAA